MSDGTRLVDRTTWGAPVSHSFKTIYTGMLPSNMWTLMVSKEISKRRDKRIETMLSSPPENDDIEFYEAVDYIISNTFDKNFTMTVLSGAIFYQTEVAYVVARNPHALAYLKLGWERNALESVSKDLRRMYSDESALAWICAWYASGRFLDKKLLSGVAFFAGRGFSFDDVAPFMLPGISLKTIAEAVSNDIDLAMFTSLSEMK